MTIVAECKSAETGVGPSIALGSQVWKKNWADLALAAMMRVKRKKMTRSGCRRC